MKLFTIGDSISQGFMSLAAARTELSFSTLLARCLDVMPGTDDYPIPLWGAGGLPLNIENLLRVLQRKYGSDIRGPLEWPVALATINEYLDEVEDFYERGAGNIALPQAGHRQFYPNVAVAGFTVADAWMVTPSLCVKRIAADVSGAEDGFFDLPNKRFERTAHAVLNPARNPAYNDFSQLRWLEEHHVNGDGVENLVLWLGSNNALGTIVRMGISRTAESKVRPLAMSLDERNQYNLWSPDDFKAEFEELMKQVHGILVRGKCPCNVFVGTVPPVTIAPLARGVGNEQVVTPDPFGVLPQAKYYERYTYFLFDLDYARRTGNSLTFAETLEIDKTIGEYNTTIRQLVASYNKKKAGPGQPVKYVLVDIANQLLQLAFKRNNERPPYQLPSGLDSHITATGRPVNTVYYEVDRQGRMKSGGVFSLDGVHPSAIGHGLIAHEFLLAMKAAGVNVIRGLDWETIVASDSLYSNPISLMPELYDNTRIAEMILDLLRLP
ncbi:MAG TPA: hypothetical protein VEX87_03750 [Skermanella sp.]|jgi:hypothetical protein|nr:hypothetical protein [Skermanella sp.]